MLVHVHHLHPTTHPNTQELDDIRDSCLAQPGSNAVLGTPQPEQVRAWTSVNAQSAISQGERRLHRASAMLHQRQRKSSVFDKKKSRTSAYSPAAERSAAVLQEYRRRLLSIVKATYGESVFVCAMRRQRAAPAPRSACHRSSTSSTS